jgi:NADH-quinone oxidoreductase subunit C
MDQSQLFQSIRTEFAKHLIGYHSYCGDETVIVRAESLFEMMKLLKEKFQFEMLMDICVVDYLGQEPRYEVVYHLNSLTHNVRLRVKVPVSEGEEEVESVTPLWQIANWLERESWDMSGIRFKNHPDLRRILMYDEFVGHPLRRDYPINYRQPRIKPKNEYR